MALASQTSRMSSNRMYMMSNSSMRRRRRRQQRLIGVTLLLVAGLALGGWLIFGGGPSGPDVALTATPQEADPETAPRQQAPDQVSQAGLASNTPPLRSEQRAAPPQSTRRDDPPPPVVETLPEPTLATRTQTQTPAQRVPDDIPVIEMGKPVDTPAQPQTSLADATPSRQPDAPQAQQRTAPPTTSAPPASGSVAEVIRQADRLVSSKPLEARDLLNRALFDRSTPERDRALLREKIDALNQRLVFGSAIIAGDTLTTSYTVSPGDSLARIASRERIDTDWRLIQRVNNISDPRRIRVGQTLKLVRGPFHAVVDKSDFRIDFYASATDSAGNRLFICSFPVGLGEYGSTPTGNFIVRPDSKLINPPWRNPRTGEFFSADNPENPLGEYWVGLDPADEATASYTEYGLHGTIEPGSIGQERSMGCVRLREPEVAIMYELLVPEKSTVRIVP